MKSQLLRQERSWSYKKNNALWKNSMVLGPQKLLELVKKKISYQFVAARAYKSWRAGFDLRLVKFTNKRNCFFRRRRT